MLLWANKEDIPVYVYDEGMEQDYFPIIQLEDIQKMVMQSRHLTNAENSIGLKTMFSNALGLSGIAVPKNLSGSFSDVGYQARDVQYPRIVLQCLTRLAQENQASNMLWSTCEGAVSGSELIVGSLA